MAPATLISGAIYGFDRTDYIIAETGTDLENQPPYYVDDIGYVM
jgi:hypothetical protein